VEGGNPAWRSSPGTLFGAYLARQAERERSLFLPAFTGAPY